MKILCKEASIEDTFPIIKRSFEKGAINFNDSIKEIRKLSRDLFNLKFHKEKNLKNFEKK